MATSTKMTDWLGSGPHSSRPASPPVSASGLPIFFETDTMNTFVWTGSAWLQLNAAAGGVTPATTTANITLTSIGSSYTLALAGYYTSFNNGSFVWIEDSSGNYLGGKVTSGGGTAAPVVTSYWQSASSGTVLSGAGVTFSGLHPGITTTTGGITIPAPGTAVSVPVIDGSAYPNGSWVLIAGSSHSMMGIVASGGGTATLSVTCVLITSGAIGNTISAGALVVPSGPVQSAPNVVQPTAGASGSTASLALALNSVASVSNQLLLIVWNNTAQTITTPTGYILLGAQSDGTVRISFYGKAAPAGTTADNPTIALSASGAVFAVALEIANGGTIAGYAGQNLSAVAMFYSPTLAASRNDLVIAAFLSHVAATIVPVNISAIWEFTFQSVVTSAGAAGSLLSLVPTVGGNVTAAEMFASAESGVGVILRIPSLS